VDGNVPADLSNLVMRLLSKSPEGRPASAAEVVEQLAAIEATLLRGQATAAPSARTSSRAAPRRPRWRLWAGAAAALLVLAGGLWLAQIIIEIRNKDGKVVSTAEVPKGGSVVEIRKKDGKVVSTAEVPKGGSVVVKQPGVPKDHAAWVKGVAALPAEQQWKAVEARLKKRNPGFTGWLQPAGVRIEGGVVTAIAVHCPRRSATADHTLYDLSPVSALVGLKSLEIPYAAVSDLLPLKGLPLTRLDCYKSSVSDLSPLKGMKLTFLECSGTSVDDLSPLKGMKLRKLSCGNTKVTDLSPLEGMPLLELVALHTGVTDLTPLKRMKLTTLDVRYTGVVDLSGRCL
jgi:hypothetical protein